jgi:hypothetical protein
MSTSSVVFMMVMVVVLTVSVCAVHWRKPAVKPAEAPDAASPEPVADLPPSYAPPADSLWTAQLEIGQTFYVQTTHATFALTLLDPVTGRYETVRTVIRDGKQVKDRFQALVIGTYVAYRGMIYRKIVPDGNLTYQKIVDGSVVPMPPSDRIVRILFDFSAAYAEPLQQAS